MTTLCSWLGKAAADTDLLLLRTDRSGQPTNKNRRYFFNQKNPLVLPCNLAKFALKKFLAGVIEKYFISATLRTAVKVLTLLHTRHLHFPWNYFLISLQNVDWLTYVRLEIHNCSVHFVYMTCCCSGSCIGQITYIPTARNVQVRAHISWYNV